MQQVGVVVRAHQAHLDVGFRDAGFDQEAAVRSAHIEVELSVDVVDELLRPATVLDERRRDQLRWS